MNRYALLLLLAMPSLATADAAIRAREGEINHWIEFYQRDRLRQPPPRAPAQDATQPQSPPAEGGSRAKDAKR